MTYTFVLILIFNVTWYPSRLDPYLNRKLCLYFFLIQTFLWTTFEKSIFYFRSNPLISKLCFNNFCSTLVMTTLCGYWLSCYVSLCLFMFLYLTSRLFILMFEHCHVWCYVFLFVNGKNCSVRWKFFSYS